MVESEAENYSRMNVWGRRKANLKTFSVRAACFGADIARPLRTSS